MLLNLFPPKKSSKNYIVNILLCSRDIKVEEIRQEIKKKHGVSITYQGISKILHALDEEKITKCKENKWELNKDWVCSIVENLQLFIGSEKIPHYTSSMKSVKFDTMAKALKFIIKNIESGQLRNEGDNLFIMHVKNIAFFNLDKKESDFIKKFLENTECHILVESKNIINKIVGKYLKSFGANVYLGISRSTPYTLTVYGNTLYYTYSTFNLTTYLAKMYNNIKDISDIKAIKLFTSLKDDLRFPIKFTFETDREIVNATRDYLLKIAKNKKI